VIRYEVSARVAVVWIDNPPVNALSAEVWAGIDEAVARAARDSSVDAVVLTGAGSTFIGGADIRVFDTLRNREDALTRSAGIHAMLRRLEDSPKPIVAAIRGVALGGGLEVAMACHYRVAAPDATVGQPEVRLGIIPGAGGTQRLPRLAGPELALDMCTGGAPISAASARAAGIIDEIAERDVLGDAISLARVAVANGTTRKTRKLADKVADSAAGIEECARTRASLPHRRSAAAAHAVVDAIEAGLRDGFDAGSLVERQRSADCILSTESRALRYLFFAEREVRKIPDVPPDTPTHEVRRAAIIGAGTMGVGIAMTYASAGIPVLLKDVDAAALERGLAAIRKNYEATRSRGKLTAGAVERALALITPTTTYDGIETADIVVEAVFEDMALKTATFADLGRVTRPGCILASNTSTLDIDALARASGRPSAVVGHHFFSPANVMRLLEIVRGRETGRDVVATSLALAKQFGKVGVVVGNCFGFVANRLLAYYMREAYLLLEEGASVVQIDQALTEFGMPVGPFGMQDIAGIDVGARIRQHLAAMGKTRADGPQSEVPDRLYEMGRYGQKTGAGWYRYETGNRTRIPDPIVDRLAEEAAARRGVTRRAIANSEIVARVTTALANEGARVLEEGFALRASDIDVIYCYGFGFPRHRGGPMFYAETVGLPTILRQVRQYREQFGDYWKPAPLLERLAAEGRGFAAATVSR
jgi:3-hydroxyacyl-CoA dehydrogenase